MKSRLSVGTLHISFSPSTMLASFAPFQGPQNSKAKVFPVQCPCSPTLPVRNLHDVYDNVAHEYSNILVSAA